MDSGEIVERGTILRATVGSTVHGLHHGGQDDRDEIAVYVEPPEHLLGLARGIRGGASMDSSITSSGRSRKALDRVRAISISSPTACGSTYGSRSKGTRQSFCSSSFPRSSCTSGTGWVRSCASFGRRCSRGGPAAVTFAISAARRSGCSAHRAEASQPTRARRGARLRHELRHARRPARLPRHRARPTGHLTLRCPSPERSGVMAIRTGERTFEETITEIDKSSSASATRWNGRPYRPSPTGPRSITSSSRRTDGRGGGSGRLRRLVRS